MNARILSIAAVSLLAASAFAAGFDRGGVTFDFAALSADRFRRPDAGATNNLANGDKCCGSKFNRLLALPHARGGIYRLAFDWRSAKAGDWVDCMLRKFYRNEKGTICRTKDPVKVIRLTASETEFLRDVDVPPGADFLGVEWRAEDLKRITVSGLALEERPAADPLEVRMIPTENLDSRFEISSNQCALALFVWRRTSSWIGEYSQRRDGFKCRLEVTLPAGVDCLGCSGGTGCLSQSRMADGSRLVTLAARNTLNTPGDAFSLRYPLGIVVKTVRPHGPIGTLTAVARCPDGRASAPHRCELYSGPEIRTAAVPRNYFNGCIVYGDVLKFDTPAATEAFAELLEATGAQGMIADARPETRQLWRRHGVRCILAESRWLANGYRIGPWAGRPPEDFMKTSGRIPKFRAGFFSSAACPRAIYEERPFFLTNTVPWLAKLAEGCDGIWANWEPYMFDDLQCLCAKCREALDRFGGDTNAFRSAEHGKIIQTVDRHVRAATGGEKSFGFIPGVSWNQMVTGARDRGEAAQYREENYAGSLKWIEPWGPYAWWDVNVRYRYEKRKPLVPYFAARDLRNSVNADYPLPNRPRLMAFPHALQGPGSALTQPEFLEMALDGYFFNGWEATVPYFFPEGYDARYWRAFARATARAAKYERYVRAGEPEDGGTRIGLVSPYASPCRLVSAYLPVKDASLLQTATWRREKSAIVAVFNFWQRGEAFFRLKTDLPEGDYAIVDDNGVRRVRDGKRRTWPAGEIRERGVTLAVGAARTRVFEFVPVAEAPAGTAMLTDAETDAALEAAKERLRQAAERDRHEGEAEVTPDGMAVI